MEVGWEREAFEEVSRSGWDILVGKWNINLRKLGGFGIFIGIIGGRIESLSKMKNFFFFYIKLKKEIYFSKFSLFFVKNS